MSFETAFILVLVGYFGVMVAEGIRSYRGTSGEADFLVAGRKVGAWIGGASISATQMSAGTFVGTIALHYLTGASFMWGWAGIWLAFIASGVWLAPRLRRYSAERGGMTFPDFIADRFDSKLAGGVVAALLVLAYIVFMSAQYQAGGVIFETIFGLPFEWGAVLLMVLVVGYTVIGGMTAVMRTDFLQQLAMAVGVLVGVPMAVAYAGGWGALGEALPTVAPEFTGWSLTWRDLLGFLLAFGLTALCSPYLLVRFYTMPDDRTIRRAVAVSLLFVLVTGICIAIIGMTMRVLYPGLSVADAASTVFAAEVLPPVVGAVVMTAVIAAVMSTVDSVLLVVGPAISRDIYHKVLRPGADEATRMRVNRLATLVIGVVPILLTLRELDIVQFVVLAFASLLASTVVVPVVLGLFWRRASAPAAVASMLAGFVTCLVWYLIGEPFIDPVVPGVLASTVAMLVVTPFTRPVGDARLAWFFAARAAVPPQDRPRVAQQ